MKDFTYIPSCLQNAARELRLALNRRAEGLSHEKFVRAWASIAYLFPGLHPDGFDHPDSGWPRVLKRFAAEAWRRSDSGDLSDSELYSCDAQWCGLFDRMHIHLPDETRRRVELAALFG